MLQRTHNHYKNKTLRAEEIRVLTPGRYQVTVWYPAPVPSKQIITVTTRIICRYVPILSDCKRTGNLIGWYWPSDQKLGFTTKLIVRNESSVIVLFLRHTRLTKYLLWYRLATTLLEYLLLLNLERISDGLKVGYIRRRKLSELEL